MPMQIGCAAILKARAMSSYIGINTEWLTDWGLTTAEAVVYGYLYGWLEVSKRELKLTQAEMAEAIGMKERTFKMCLAKLIAYGLVTTERTGMMNTYHLHTRVLNNVESAKSAQSVNIAQSAKSAQSKCKIGTKVSANFAPSTLYNIKDNIEIISDDDARTRTREGEDEKREKEQAALGQVGEVEKLADELRQEIDNGSQLADSALRLYGMTAADLKDNLTWFCDKLRLDGVSYKSRSDFRRHFNNWLRIRAQQKLLNHGNNNNGNRHQPRYSAEFMARLHADLTSGH